MSNINFIDNNKNLESIKEVPKELINIDRWSYSQLKYVDDDGKERGKAPCNISGYNVNWKDPKNLHPFKKVVENNPKKLYHSFHLNKEYVCIDLDGAFNSDGDLYSWAEEIIDTFDSNDYYMEYSLSGKGLHIIGKADDNLLYALGNKDEASVQINKTHKKHLGLPDKCKFEIFSNRMIVLTGNYYKSKCVEIEIVSSSFMNALRAINSLLKIQWLNTLEKNKNMLNDTKKDKTNSEHINKIIKTKQNVGDVFEYVKYTVSISDVMNHYSINYSTGKNINCFLDHEDKTPSMRVYDYTNTYYCFSCRQSGTVIDIVMNMEGFDQPFEAVKKLNEIFNLNIEFSKESLKREKRAQLHAKYSGQWLTTLIENGLSEKYVDRINANGGVDWIKEDENEKTGKITIKVKPALLAKAIKDNSNFFFCQSNAKASIQRFLYNGQVYKSASENDFIILIKKHIPEFLQKPKDIRDTLFLVLTNDNFISYEKLNPEKYINFANGLLSTETWEIEQHSHKVYSTIQIPCDYVKDAKKPENSRFDYYMNFLTEDKKEIRKLITDFMALAVSNFNVSAMKKCLFMVGKGDTGKSVAKNLLIDLIGIENADTSDLSDIESRFGTSRIFNKRLVGSNDMGFIKLKELKIFKQMTGGDKITYEFKNERTFQGSFTGLTWCCCNELPSFGGDRGDWTYDRIVVVKCDNVVPVEDRDEKLKDYLYNEREYIISTLIENLKEIKANNNKLVIPEECERNLDEYKKENNGFLQFLEECTLERTNGYQINRADFYRFYTAWAKENVSGGYVEPKKEVKKLLKQKKLDVPHKTNGTFYYENMEIAIDVINDYMGIVEKIAPSKGLRSRFYDVVENCSFTVIKEAVTATIEDEQKKELKQKPENKLIVNVLDKNNKVSLYRTMIDLDTPDLKVGENIFFDDDNKLFVPEFVGCAKISAQQQRLKYNLKIGMTYKEVLATIEGLRNCPF